MSQLESSKDEIVLGILGAVEQDSALTQRRVASELGIALGLANTYVKRCVKKGFVKVRQAPARRYAYYLTPKGFAEKSRLTAYFLARSLSFFGRASAECNELLETIAASGARSITLLGGGDLADIMRLLAGKHGIAVEIAYGGTTVQSVISDAKPADHYVVTALSKPHELYTEALRVFGSENVSAPELLRLSPASAVAQTRARREAR